MAATTKPAERKRVCIIGGGATGLVSIKACLEEDHVPICYEVDSALGGLWRYKEDNEDGLASVMRSTIINTCKELSAFSDFPPPAHLPNYMHNSKMLEYFQMYARHFDLERHIRFRHKVLRVEPGPDFDLCGNWRVTVQNLETGDTTEEIFDAVMVATGHHGFPSKPHFPNQEKFQGKILHSHDYKKPEGYEDKRILVVGIGNSGVDVAVELSQVTDKVYLSTRRGAWIVNRVGDNGKPIDELLINRFTNFWSGLLPRSLVEALAQRKLNKRFDHEKYRLKPKHGYFQQHPTVNDALPNRILSGTICVKGNVSEFTPNGVIFEGETEETPIDIAVLCTGYKIKFPFLNDDLIRVEKNKVELYKYVFPVNLKFPTLAIMGLTQTVGAIIPASEIQARWFALVLGGKIKLPSRDDMVKDIEAKSRAMAERYVPSERHTIQVDWIPYMDEIASLIGAKPNLLKLMVTDFELFLACLFKACMPYQYRLVGPHPWPGARQAILNHDRRVLAPLATKALQPDLRENNAYLFSFALFILLGYLMFVLL